MQKATTLVRNIASGWGAQLVGIAVSFLVAPYVVRGLGNVYYGIWVLLGQFTGYLWLFDFGVRESVVKYVAEYHSSGQTDEVNRTIRAAVVLYSGIAGVALLAVALIAAALPYLFNIPPEAVRTAQWTALITGATIAQGFVFNVFVGVLMGLQRYDSVARLGVVFALLRAALIVGALQAGYGVIGLALVQLLVSVASSLVTLRLCRRHLPSMKLSVARPTRDDFWRHFHYGKYVFVNNVGEKLIFSTDSLVIGVFLPVSSLTYYAIAGSLIDYMRGFVASMAAVFNPYTSALQARGRNDAIAEVFFGATKASVLIGLPVCIGFLVLGERFISLWIGSAYGHAAAPILTVLTIAHAFGLPHYTIVGVLYGLGRHRAVAQCRIVEAIANVVLSVTLVRVFGLVGVAMGTSIPHLAVTTIVLPIVVSRVLGLSLRRFYLSSYVRPCLAAIPFLGVCVLIDRVAQPSTLAAFFVVVGAGLIAYVVPVWFVALTTPERTLVAQKLKSSVPYQA